MYRGKRLVIRLDSTEAARRLGESTGASQRAAGFPHLQDSTFVRAAQESALAVRKHGKRCIVAKVVRATPLGEMVLAMPYRHRQEVTCVSLPPAALAFARRAGARLWLVRLDQKAECVGLLLSDVERLGWLKASDGQPEWFVPLAAFRPLPWQDWQYVEKVVELDAENEEPAQMALGFEVAI